MNEETTADIGELERAATELQSLCDEIVRTGRLLSATGLSPGTTGNISVSHGERIICTPTGADLSQLSSDALSVLSRKGEHIHGPRPTKEWFMHAAMYGADTSIKAIVHLHSSYATSASCLTDLNHDDAIPPLTPYLTMKAGNVALVPYFAPGDPLVAEPICELVAKGIRVMLLANHGSLVGADTLFTATAISQELEEAAKIYFITQGHPVRQLTAEERAVLRNRNRTDLR